MSSSTSDSDRSLRQTLIALAVVVAVVEFVVVPLLRPIDLVDARQFEASHMARERRTLVLGDSVANQLAPPMTTSRARQLAQQLHLLGPLPDHRGPIGARLDHDHVFLTAHAGLTVWGDVLLYRSIRRSGGRPSAVVLLMSWGGWQSDDKSPYFHDAVVSRFNDLDQIWNTYRFSGDAQLAWRMAALAWLPSARLRGPVGQRLLNAPVALPASLGIPAPGVASAWNIAALRVLAAETTRDRVPLVVDIAPYSDRAGSCDAAFHLWRDQMRSIRSVQVPDQPPERWPDSEFRDGQHLRPERTSRIAQWFAAWRTQQFASSAMGPSAARTP